MKSKTNLIEVLGLVGSLAVMFGTLAVLAAAAFADIPLHTLVSLS
jgi:hypothetical protein